MTAPGQKPPWAGPSSVVYEALLAVMAMLSVLPGFARALGLDATSGQYVYVGLVILVVAGLVLARKREEKLRKWERQQRENDWRSIFANAEDASQKAFASAEDSWKKAFADAEGAAQLRHQELRELFLLAVRAAAAGSAGKPIVSVVEGATGAIGQMAGPAAIGVGGASGPTGPRVPLRGTIQAGFPRLLLGPGGLQFVRKLSQHFPTTPEGMEAAARQLEEFLIDHEGEIPLTGSADTHHGAKGGEVVSPPPPLPSDDSG